MAGKLRMSIKGIYVVPRPLSDGRTRYHYYAYRNGPKFWTSEGKRIDLPGKRLDPEFVAAYNEAVALERGPQKGSLAETVCLYRKKCVAFRKMKPKGQAARIGYLDKWLEMPLHGAAKAADAPLSIFDSRRVIKFITTHRDTVWGHSPSAADEAVIALSAFLTWCKKDGRLDWNRAHGIDPVYQRPTEARIWSDQEQIAFLESAPTHLAWAFKLALFTGLRREDLIRLPVSCLTRDHIIIPTSKSRGRNTALIPVTPPLKDLLDEIDETRNKLKTEPITVLFSSRGTPWTAEGFGTSFDRHRTKVGLGPENQGPTIHDLRKTCATNMIILQHLYPALISDQILVDLFGWTPGTLAKMKRIYVSDSAVIDAMTRRK